MFLLLVRGFVLVVFVLWLFYLLNPSVECALNERWQYAKDHFSRMSDVFQERQFEVNPKDRRPAMQYKEFAKNRRLQQLQRYMMSRSTFGKDQQVVGSVMTNGPNAGLPPLARWENGVIAF